MFVPGLPKGLQKKLEEKLEESFEMFVDKCIKLHEESQSELSFADWWKVYKAEKGYKKKGDKKK